MEKIKQNKNNKITNMKTNIESATNNETRVPSFFFLLLNNFLKSPFSLQINRIRQSTEEIENSEEKHNPTSLHLLQ